MRIKSPRDFWAGVMFIAFGVFFVAVATTYAMGTLRRMGPGYFPTALGALMTLLGVVVLARSLASDGPNVPRLFLRPTLFVLAACLGFAYLLRPLGLVVATVLTIFVSAFGGPEFRWKEVAILAVVLAVGSVLAFVGALSLPFPIWPAFIG